MKSRLWAIAALALAVTVPGHAQPVLQTMFGGASDGVPALLAALGTPSAVATAPDGNIYVILEGTRRVVRIDPSGKVWAVAGNGASGSTGDGGPATQASLKNPTSVAADAAGNVYIADSQAARVRRVGPDGVINTFAGNGQATYTGDGGPADQASLNNPQAITFDPSGNLLIADTSNNTVRRVTPDGIITTIAGTGAQGDATSTGPARQNPLNMPAGLAVDNSGNIFIADTGNNWIQKVTPDGAMARYAGISSSGFSLGGDPTLAINTSLSNPTRLAVDRNGNLYITEHAWVFLVTPDGKIASYAGTGMGGSVGDGGLARYADIHVLDIAIDAKGNLLIADGVNNRLRIVTAATGIIDTFAGDGQSSLLPQGLALKGTALYISDSATDRVWQTDLVSGQSAVVAGTGTTYTGTGDDATSTGLYSPQGLAFDNSGNLYIADSKNNRVRRVTADGKISVFAGNGTAGTSGDGSAATSATLNQPYAVAVDSAGNVLIAERSGHVVRRVSTSGVISTVAGTGTSGAPSAETGVAVNQSLNSPSGLAVESAGTVLIADSGNNRIRRLFSDGTIATVAGSATAGFSGDGGQATSARLNAPAAVAVDIAGNLYVSDAGNQRIRQVGTDGIISTIAGNGTAGYNGDGTPATAHSLSSPGAILAYSGCSVVVADTSNQRIRQVWPAINYTINSSPAGLPVTLDGQAMATPAAVQLLPGTKHSLDAPSPVAGSAGARYVSPGPQAIDVPCGAPRAALTFSLALEYALSVAVDDGGTVTPVAAWQNAGSSVTLQAAPKTGYVFSGWEGNCQGSGSCTLLMDGPKAVKADFTPSSTQKATIASGGVVGAGLSTPPVTAVSSNALALVFGSSFAPAGTLGTADTSHLVNGKISTELDGVCVLVGGAPAPILAVTPTQINFQVPQVATSGTVQVQVSTSCGTGSEKRSDAVTMPAQSATPEFFYFTNSGAGHNPIAAVDGVTGTYIGTPGLVTGATFVPAKPGEVLSLYATGLGATNPPFDAGALPDRASSITGNLTITIASVTVPQSNILYAGVAPGYAGLYQINVRLPDTVPNGDQPVQLIVNGIASPADAYITIQQ